MPEATAISSPTRNGNGTTEVTFPELVRAHHLWETSTDAATGEARLARFKQLLDDFQSASGQVIDAYWCHKEASAVALTRRETTKRGRFGRKRKIEYRLHRVSDWVTDRTTRSPTCCTTRTSSASRPPRASRACRAPS